MFNTPQISIDVEGISQQVEVLFTQNNTELTKYIVSEIKKQLTEEWVQEQLQEAVKDCITNAISDVANNYNLKVILTDLITQKIGKQLMEKQDA